MSLSRKQRTFKINDVNFIFENKFTYNHTALVNVSVFYNRMEKILDKEVMKKTVKKLVFARSHSECGMWRLCQTKPDDVGKRFYLQKGTNYTMSTFIIIELQMFLNSILDKLDEAKNNSIETCITSFKDNSYGVSTINNRSRETTGIEISGCVMDNSTIGKVSKYNYQDIYSNPHPVVEKTERDYEALDITDKAKTWPVGNLERTSILLDRRISHGETSIKLNGNIYSVILDFMTKKYVFYFMIYDCLINTPEDLYNNPYIKNNDNYKFQQEINARNLILPVYLVPYDSITTELRPLLKYGLYDKFTAFRYNRKGTDFSKVLNYIQQCVRIPNISTPVCTTSYTFTGYYFDHIFQKFKQEFMRENASKRIGKFLMTKKILPKRKSHSISRRMKSPSRSSMSPLSSSSSTRKSTLSRARKSMSSSTNASISSLSSSTITRSRSKSHSRS